SSQPDLGKNAILPLIEFVHQAQIVLAADNQVDSTLGKLTHVVSQIQGGSQINTVPAHAWLTGNIRTIPAYSNELVMQQLDKIVQQLNASGAQLKITYSYPEPPLPTQAHTRLAKLASHVLQDQFHLSGNLTAG
ncbi:succinyl-diaminopimelate desuccinylase, partial [Lactobacillus sp. XV13L]|nr:succinyl-diaminopimelate desuccinylase [Lactobacillus sp. XV13L]